MPIFDYSLIISFFTLSFLEIILGIDNLIFIALVVHKLPKNIKKTARIFGLSLALIIRILIIKARDRPNILAVFLIFFGNL